MDISAWIQYSSGRQRDWRLTEEKYLHGLEHKDSAFGTANPGHVPLQVLAGGRRDDLAENLYTALITTLTSRTRIFLRTRQTRG